tara:strand:- start:7405 stop:7638 length:234 start_codon:yes stop_codon:yes gene_type:complete
MRPKKERDIAHDASIARAEFCAQLAVNDKLSYALISAFEEVFMAPLIVSNLMILGLVAFFAGYFYFASKQVNNSSEN